MRAMIAALGLAACLCAVAACGGANEAGNAPVALTKPPSWDDQGNRDWLYRMQFKDHMRHLWIDANRIASAGRGDEQPAWDEIWAGAADIAQRSALMQRYWEGVRDGAAEGLLALEDDDRIGTADAVRAAGLACDGCHMATWSPAYLHVTGGVLDAWAAGKNTPADHLETDKNPPPEIPARRVMANLWRHLQAAQVAVKDWDKPALEAAFKEIQGPATSGASMWKTVHDHAAAIEAAARARKRDGMGDAYKAMRATCIVCHAANAGPDRPILTPLAWE